MTSPVGATYATRPGLAGTCERSSVVVDLGRVVVVRPKRFCALAVGVPPSTKAVSSTAIASATAEPIAMRRVGRRGVTRGDRLERIIVDGRRGWIGPPHAT